MTATVDRKTIPSSKMKLIFDFQIPCFRNSSTKENYIGFFCVCVKFTNFKDNFVCRDIGSNGLMLQESGCHSNHV